MTNYQRSSDYHHKLCPSNSRQCGSPKSFLSQLLPSLHSVPTPRPHHHFGNRNFGNLDSPGNGRHRLETAKTRLVCRNQPPLHLNHNIRGGQLESYSKHYACNTDKKRKVSIGPF
ncbi:hypothetical protein WG66_013942 [Moniliophthora roreri]|nr:hypothetical protein WG66_013942 [Moniliophthora roreri]